ncbi:MAG: hypothetical protein Q4F31_10860 [Eubacteriales bacterium]|nr:hypothetical protein [Eubacteriales bacterium]
MAKKRPVPKRMRVNTAKLAAKVEEAIPEVICIPKEDEYQITCTLLTGSKITFDLLPAHIQKQLPRGLVLRTDFSDLIKNVKDLL